MHCGVNGFYPMITGVEPASKGRRLGAASGGHCGGVPEPPWTAEPFVPASRSLPTLQRAVQSCTGCPLYAGAIQAVFGAGPRSASIMLVGEQPGDQEDKQGVPFVGPAGRVLWSCLEAAGIDRDDIYATNAVKHF